MRLNGKLGRWGLAAVALALVAGGSALASAPVRAQAPTSIPVGRFYGNVTVLGTKAPTNLTLSATIGTTICSGTQASTGGIGSSEAVNDGTYWIDIQAVPGCTTPGATVVFSASGGAAGSYKATQTGTVPQLPGTPVHLDLDFQQPAKPTATAPPPPPPPAAKTPTAAPPPAPKPATATPAAKPVVQQAPAAAAYAPVAGARLPNTGTGGLLDQQTTETGWALLVIVLAALGVSATGLVAYRRQR